MILPRKELESNDWRFTNSSCLLFNSASVASVAIFESKSELSINPEISDLSTNPFSFILALSISTVNLL